jgi:hypothetical protein
MVFELLNMEFLFLAHTFMIFIAALGWCISLLGLLQVPIWAIYAIVLQKDQDWWRVRKFKVLC